MKSKWTVGIITIVILSILSLFLAGFKLTTNKEPKEVYNVYLDGEKIGTVKSKEDFEKYINNQEEKLKEKYGVSKIYTPKGVEIKKVITYKDNCDSNEKIYKLLVKEQNFTVKGIIINIEKEEQDKDDKEKTITTSRIINVTSKDIFDKAIVDIIKAFLDENICRKEGSRIEKSLMYKMYDEYCTDNGRKPLGKSRFMTEMERKG